MVVVVRLSGSVAVGRVRMVVCLVGFGVEVAEFLHARLVVGGL